MRNVEIQMVDLKTQYHRLKSEIDEALNKVIENGIFIQGPPVSKFSSELSEYLDCKNVIPCANGTDALQIAMMACGFKPGDEVIVPAFTYVATVEVIALLGLVPIFVDVNENDFNINIEALSESITERTVGIVPVHLFGQCADMDKIMAIADENNLKVIEDTAQAIGSVYFHKNATTQFAGTIGDIGTTSFFPSKNLGCFGDGGALMTNSGDHAKQCRMIANHGQSEKYIHDIIGVNSRLDTLQAALLSVKLKELNDFSKRRQLVADRYDVGLKDISEIITPHRNSYSTHVFHQYTVQIEGGNRDDLKKYLHEKQIPSMIYYPIPVHLQKAYNQYGYKTGQFPIAESLCKKVLSLPIHTEMHTDQQEYIIDNIRSYFK
ncbi:DegT/DnrJ/EryC1/StrS family aminotransferase [Fulvivirga lutimaris]|uniref:DegT/DnrJ/EryC1/StrS family aminotransferase n=1 Tax=Fulvivirga lutimaris TaxID=1819566 RepID=UPI0012BD3827|nr:DegT/DnrJ/EryC1/StrS family aminotransferase [Fulvivirga lutimaris]MTI39306.1 DegT/DnrJ/EryC1/StrS family aminotransferase [Fulvivirga lutimaris]